ncbi:ribonuclease H-like domain-containing protein [Massariosphaeria phaeospora]|uniref:RNA exonuclease 4 n=1 Tax=Massariosphaeria phaeospora TaxID=100035 RepID=A0A7C8I9V8_9PLEO|nr:ribonuclease H-like domain-containing protein [Massariosphaeria phaeospora]
MAPIDLSGLSSNWKKLQKTLPLAKPPSSKLEAQEQQGALKRKRSTKLDGERPHRTSNSVNGAAKTTVYKRASTRKRQKMEEPASIGASVKQHDPKTLSRSVSMPSLKHAPLLASSKAAAESLSILTPSAAHPDIENEGVSSTALPGKYIALDCEMVGTGPEPDRDSALARVSAVNYHGHQVYDSYVQVKVAVTDYRSAVSGIHPRHIRHDTARPFKEVHNDLKILLQGRILVGHAVKNDLDALLLKHDKRFIRDTSKYSKFRELANIPGRTPGLKLLAEKLLGVEIQVGAHSSVEDARATMALFKLEKDGFDTEVISRYGHIRMDAAGPEVDVGGGDAVTRKSKNKKKKKKKKN